MSRGLGQRHARKVIFPRENRHEILGTIKRQIQEKNEREVSEKVDHIIQSRLDNRALQLKLVEDRMKNKEKERWLRNDFDQANLALKSRNASEAKALKKAIQTADVNAPDSFPFTHGDCIERQRRHLS